MSAFQSSDTTTTMNSEIRTNDSTQDAARVPPVIDADKSVEPEHQDAALAPDDFGSGPSKLNMRFLAFDGQCIPKLGVLVRWPGGSCLSKTDADGCLPPIEARPGAGLKIAVQRFDGSYKEIGGCAMPATDGELTLVSPKIVFEIQTEAHAGAPGDAEKHVPRLDTADHGDLVPARVRAAKENEALASVPPTGTTQPTPANAAAPTPAKPPAKSVIAPAAKAKPVANKPPQHISGRTETKPTIHKGRDANGNPLAVITEKALDWWNSWRLPTFDLWGRVEAAGKVARSPRAATPVVVSADMQAKLDTLLTFAKDQTQYKYLESEGSAALVATMARKTFHHKKGEKETNTSIGQCYKYVKVALVRARIVDQVVVPGQADDIQRYARRAAPFLLASGFVDVTEQVPDARWAAAGDVIVYEWTPENWAKKKKKKSDPKLPNYGHIDIRSVETYISDFVTDEYHSFHPQWLNYKNICIYRKVFDPLPTLRIKAFLRCIREFECQREHDDTRRYNMLNCALPTASGLRFSNFDSHPWDAIPPQQRGESTSAGAYQIKHATWKEKFDQGLIEVPPGNPRFTPDIQDRIAVMKIEDRKALHFVRAGKVEDAIALKDMKSEWTSLPGGKENAKRHTATGGRMDTAYFLKLFDTYLTEEKRKVGLL